MHTSKLIPQEIEVWYVIPALRSALAQELKKQGMLAVEIAGQLGVTKAAVTHYLKKDRATAFVVDAKLKKEIEKSAARIKKGASSALELQRLIIYVRKTKAICQFHNQKEHLDENCKICFQKI
jgi:predicted transcriptional regulator